MYRLLLFLVLTAFSCMVQAKCFHHSNQAILKTGDQVFSDNGVYFLTILNKGGNLRLYDMARPANDREIWGPHTQQSAELETLKFVNGTLSLIRGTNKLWNAGGGKGTSFCVQNDGNLVIYQGNKVAWASNTQRKVFSLVPVGVGSISINACGNSITLSELDKDWLDHVCSKNTSTDNVMVTFSGTSNRCYLTYKDKKLSAHTCDNNSVVIKNTGDKFLFLCQQKSPGDSSCSWVTTQKLSATTMLSSSLYN